MVQVMLWKNSSAFKQQDLCLSLSVAFGIKRRLGDQDRVGFRRNLEFIVQCPLQERLIVPPVGDNTPVNWMIQVQNASLSHCTIKDFLMLWRQWTSRGISNDSWDHRSWSVISSETQFPVAAALVDDHSFTVRQASLWRAAQHLRRFRMNCETLGVLQGFQDEVFSLTGQGLRAFVWTKAEPKK